jgi:predicted HTH domain antitoxin
MKTATVEVSEELLVLLRQSRLAFQPLDEQVRTILAMQLAQEGVISTGKAAELSGESRAAFEETMSSLGFWPVQYDLEEYEQDRRGIAEARRRAGTV